MLTLWKINHILSGIKHCWKNQSLLSEPREPRTSGCVHYWLPKDRTLPPPATWEPLGCNVLPSFPFSLLTSTWVFLLPETSHFLPRWKFLSMTIVSPVLHKAPLYCSFSPTLFSTLVAFSGTHRSLQVSTDWSLLGVAVSPPLTTLLGPSTQFFGISRPSPLTRFEDFQGSLIAKCDMLGCCSHYLSPFLSVQRLEERAVRFWILDHVI